MFHEIGEYVSIGWADGIEAEGERVVSATKGIASDVVRAGEGADMFASSTYASRQLSTSHGSGGPYQQPVVNITGNNFTVASDMDARKLAETIGTEVQRQLAGRVA